MAWVQLASWGTTTSGNVKIDSCAICLTVATAKRPLPFYTGFKGSGKPAARVFLLWLLLEMSKPTLVQPTASTGSIPAGSAIPGCKPLMNLGAGRDASNKTFHFLTLRTQTLFLTPQIPVSPTATLTPLKMKTPAQPANQTPPTLPHSMNQLNVLSLNCRSPPIQRWITCASLQKSKPPSPWTKPSLIVSCLSKSTLLFIATEIDMVVESRFTSETVSHTLWFSRTKLLNYC